MNAENQERAKNQSGVTNSSKLLTAQSLKNWQTYARQRKADALDRVKTRLLEQASDGRLTADAMQHALRRLLGTELIHDLLHDCAEWSGDKIRSSAAEQSVFIDSAMGENLAHLIPTDISANSSNTGTQPYRWLIPSFGGGLLGLMLLGPDGIGGTLGALFGAAAGVAGVAWLAEHRESLVHPNRTATGDDMHPTHAGAWIRLVPLVRSPGFWLLRKAKRLSQRLAAGLLDLVLPSPPITTSTLTHSAIAPACEKAFDLLTTLVFLRWIGVEDCATRKKFNEPNALVNERSVLRALLSLMRTLDLQPTDTEKIYDLAEELHQRLEDAGYFWEMLPDGTLFQEEYRQRFLTFGLVAPGEPVETLEPCFRCGETVLLPGRITKQRG